MTNGNTSLLAHLAWKLTNQTETLATEALGYILSQSTAARQALQETIRTGGADIGPIASVATEARGKKNERVDLAALDEQGTERVLIEVKFWAGLTDNQPNTYLERLPADGNPAVLLFVAPEARLETLWPEVLRRADGRFDLSESAGSQGIRTAIVDNSARRLMLTSWRALLGSMSSRASVEGDSSAERDILQLNALCEREDAEAFLPIRSGEFGPDVPRRMLNLQRLIDDATARGRKEGFISTKGLRVTPQSHGYGTWIGIGSKDTSWAIAWFGVDYRAWARDEETPLWLNFIGSPNMPLSDITERLGGYQRYYFTLPTGVEYDAVLDSVVEELREVAEEITAAP